MKTIKILSLILLSVVLTLSCNNTSDHHGHETTEAAHAHETTEAIELNNGERWVVNQEMIPFVEQSVKLMAEYDGADYKTLAAGLKENNNKLIKSCTMEGKSHDELHKWLHPHLDYVKALGKAESQEEADKIIEDLKESFNTYNTYFQ